MKYYLVKSKSAQDFDEHYSECNPSIKTVFEHSGRAFEATFKEIPNKIYGHGYIRLQRF